MAKLSNKLKTFENHLQDYYKHYGLSPDDIQFFFTDLTDSGWKVDSQFSKKYFQYSVSDQLNDGDVKLGLLPVIKIEIYKDYQRFQSSPWITHQELYSLMNSKEFLEIIEVVSSRLNEVNLYISKQYIENARLILLIYRKQDKEITN